MFFKQFWLKTGIFNDMSVRRNYLKSMRFRTMFVCNVFSKIETSHAHYTVMAVKKIPLIYTLIIILIVIDIFNLIG